MSLLAKLKCGCERERCYDCGKVIARLVWRRKCIRHAASWTSGIFTTMVSWCERCAHARVPVKS